MVIVPTRAVARALLFLCLCGATPLLLHFAAEAQSNSQVLKEARYLMGTVLEISIVEPAQGDPENLRHLLEESFDIVASLENSLSNYQEQSEVSRFNAQGALQPSREFSEFLEVSQSLVKQSGGLFNPLVRPLVELWRRAEIEQKIPSKEQLQQARSCLSFWPTWEEKTRTVFATCPGMALETGGIGKGFAVDKVVSYLRAKGVRNALVHFGHSSTFALGNAADGKPWKLLLRFGEEPALGEIELANLALSASDSIGRGVNVAGQHYGHIIDPRNGFPLVEKIQSVVVTSSASSAEAMSKIVILRSRAGQELPADVGKGEAVFWRLLNREQKIIVENAVELEEGMAIKFSTLRK